jgi:AraC family transcriptional regulator, arabinose operon regulatory protein
MSTPIRLREGFRGQIQYVIPRPLLERIGGHPLLLSLVPTDIGWYPAAEYHYRERPEGAAEHILIYCVGGAGWVEVAGQRQTVQPGEALIIPAQTPHAYAADADTPWSIHWVHFAGLEGDYFARLAPANRYVIAVDPSCAARVEALFEQGYAAYAEGFGLPRLIHCAKLLHHLLAELCYNNLAFSSTTRTHRFHSLEPTLAFLRQNLHRSLTLAEMAHHAGLSESHFSHTFRAQTSHSPMDYFIGLKMQHACTLLTLSPLAVKEIAEEVGYRDPYYFSRLFKRVMGVSPTEYRASPKG